MSDCTREYENVSRQLSDLAACALKLRICIMSTHCFLVGGPVRAALELGQEVVIEADVAC